MSPSLNNPSALEGSGTLVKIAFNVSADANIDQISPLAIDSMLINEGMSVTTVDGVFTVSDEQEIKIPLSAGWNLISLPIQPSDLTPGVVLSSIEGKYDSVWGYDSDTGWSRYKPGSESNLTELEPRIGYWLKMHEAETLLIQGTKLTETTISLKEGVWNFVGYCFLGTRDTDDCMYHVRDSINSVWGYAPDIGWSVWSIYIPSGMSDLESMKPGYGYCISVNKDCIWNAGEVQ